MPFDVLPQEIGTGTFRKFADAILIGCQKHPVQCRGAFYSAGATCALGAMAFGLGFIPNEDGGDINMGIEDFLPSDPMWTAYYDRYGCSIPEDNDKTGFSREQIAARIAAL